MGYIYKIINDINDKIYIGQTINNINHRLQTHINTALRAPRCKFHYAIKDIGPEHFTILLIEECQDNLLDDREKYWIKYYNTVENGYNTTLGGSSGFHYDRNIILKYWNQGMIIQEISDKLGIDRGLLGQILKTEGITQTEINERRYISTRVQEKNRKIYQIDPNTGEIIKLWNSIGEIERELHISHSSIIGCCMLKPRIKTAGGFTWRYFENYNPEKDKESLIQYCVNETLKNTKHVLQYSYDGVLLKEYNSTKDAGESVGKNSRNIARYCRGDRKDPDRYVWKYKE